MTQTTAFEPIPVTVLSGFLGSGKTTLLNVLLAGAARGASEPERMAVIVNEFGEVGIDGALIAGGEQFVELDNGCLCCVLNDDLVATLQALVARGGIDRILIETTGLADPLPVGWACSRPGLGDRLRLDAIVTVVDAVSARDSLQRFVQARVQAERADVLVLSKCETTADGGDDAAAAAREHNQEALCLRSHRQFADVDASVLLGRFAEGPLQPSEAASAHAHAHVQDVQSVTWQRPCQHGAVNEALVEALAYEVPAEVVRFKGLFFVDAEEGPWLLVHGVAGRIDMRFLSVPRPPEQSSIVFFGEKLDHLGLHDWVQAKLLPVTAGI